MNNGEHDRPSVHVDHPDYSSAYGSVAISYGAARGSIWRDSYAEIDIEEPDDSGDD